MANEKIYQQNLVISSGMLTPKGRLKLHDLLAIIQEASIEGSAFVGAGVEKIRQHNLYWVVMSYRFEIYRLPVLDERITVSTYPSDNRAFIYPRHYKITDQNGGVLIRGASLWALLDLSTHKPSGPENNGFLLQGVHGFSFGKHYNVISRFFLLRKRSSVQHRIRRDIFKAKGMLCQSMNALVLWCVRVFSIVE